MTKSETLYDALCHVIGNTCRIMRTAKSYGWNASGRGAIAAQQCFIEQAEELHNAIDPLARHLVGLGGSPIFDYSDAIVQVDPPTIDSIPTLAEMVDILANGHIQANHSIAAAMDIAREIDEVATVQILALRIAAHRGFRQRLLLVSGQL